MTFLRSLPLLVSFLVFQQDPTDITNRPREDIKLPNGKSQKDAILKADHAKNLEDADRIAELAAGLKKSLEKNTEHVLSLDDLKKLDEIDKTARRIRSRIRRY